jgi:hypothetical protein
MSERNEDEADRIKQALETIDESKRDSMRKLVAGAFVTPVVASFASSGLTVAPAFASIINSTHS